MSRLRHCLPILGGLAASGAALAEDLVVEVGEPIALLNQAGLRLEGNWSRVYPAHDGDGWVIFVTGGDTYNYMTMDASFNVTSEKLRLVTDWPVRLVDHMITQCPDGTWFHVASANIDRPNDSAYVFRYDEDYNLLCSGTVGERDTEYSYNDAPLVCTGGATITDPMDGTATHTETEAFQTPFMFFNEDCEPTHQELHPTFPPASGSSITYDPARPLFWQVRSAADDFNLLFQFYSDWMEPIDYSVSIDTVVPEDQTTQWPQGAMTIGDYYVVAHLARAPGVNYSSDTGDLWLQVFDQEINHLQAIKLAEFGDDEGAQRPWLSRRGEQLIVTYTEYDGPNFNPSMMVVGLNPDLLEPSGGDGGDGGDGADGGDGSDGGTDGSGDGGDGADGGDDGSVTDGGDDGSEDPATSSPKDSGCATGGGAAGGALAALALLAVGRRQRRG